MQRYKLWCSRLNRAGGKHSRFFTCWSYLPLLLEACLFWIQSHPHESVPATDGRGTKPSTRVEKRHPPKKYQICTPNNLLLFTSNAENMYMRSPIGLCDSTSQVSCLCIAVLCIATCSGVSPSLICIYWSYKQWPFTSSSLDLQLAGWSQQKEEKSHAQGAVNLVLTVKCWSVWA